MGKKYSIILQKPKCVKCGCRLQVDRSETNYNAGKIVGYCFKREKHDGKVLKFRIESLFTDTPTSDNLLKVKHENSEYD